MLVQADTPVTIINFKAISTTVVLLRISSVKVIKQTGILITMLVNIMKLILTIKMNQMINLTSNRITKIMIRISSLTRTKATTKINSRTTISNLLNQVKPTKDKKKPNKKMELSQTILLPSRLSSTVATHPVENPTSLSDEQDEMKFVLYNWIYYSWRCTVNRLCSC